MTKLSKEEGEALVSTLQAELNNLSIEYPKKKSNESYAGYIEMLESLLPDDEGEEEENEIVSVETVPKVKEKKSNVSVETVKKTNVSVETVSIKIIHSTCIQMTICGERTTFINGEDYSVSADVADSLIAENFAVLIA